MIIKMENPRFSDDEKDLIGLELTRLGKVHASIIAAKKAEEEFNRNIVYLEPTHEIAPIPPFYREKKETIQVLGTENLCWDWNHRDMIGECTHRNCRSEVRFYAAKPLGHTFFFDIDENPFTNRKTMFQELDKLLFPFDISHYIITRTMKGFHLWITDIREQKISWFTLFQSLKNIYKSDYEFHGQWILRLGRKPSGRNPFFIGFRRNPDVQNKLISNGHLVLLERYAYMPHIVRHYLRKNNSIKSTFARQVLYHSFDVHGNKIDDRRF